MKFLILLGLCLVLTFAAAAPVDPPTILKYDSNNDGTGNYNFDFETSDGIKRQEQSEVLYAADPENASLVVRGSFSYTGPDGIVYSVNYVADENGFQPHGAHIPVADSKPSLFPPPIVGQAPTDALVASLLG